MTASHFPGKPPRWLMLAFGLVNLLLPVLAARPAFGAERILLSYGIFERSISIHSLETYARTGKINDELANYADNVDRRQLAQLRRILLARIPLNPVEVSQFLYTPIGQRLLDRLTAIIETDAPQSGFYGIRSALILASADPDGLTLLNVLRQFPLPELKIDLAQGQAIAQSVADLIDQTEQAVSLINQQASLNATGNATSAQAPAAAVNLEQPGQFRWTKQTIILTDRSRGRTFPADIYLPQVSTARPVIVISHGLGSDRASFAYLAEHLASYGFVVAVPEHPGSSADQLQALLDGRAAEVVSPREFIDRPLDVTYLLDELTRLSQSDPDFQGRLNLQQVGVLGQSFGGYTALALAGAPLRLNHLQTNCRSLETTLNLSLLLQCVALRLPQSEYNLADPRIKAAIAINPVDSSIMGRASLSQITMPLMMVSGSNDTIAPALAEQIHPFTWLTTPDKYLVLINNGTHFSTIDESPNAAIPVPDEVIGPRPALARDYARALSVAFFETYIANQPSYRAYLSPAYVGAIGRQPLKLSLVRSLTATQLAQVLGRLR
jgi:predicted dienelactone hydrolase